MGRNLVTGCGAAFAVLLISGQCVFAQKLSDEQRAEVKSIVAETEKKIGEQIKASTNELAALIKSQRSDPSPAQSQSAEVPSSTTLQLLAASLVGQTPAGQTPAATGNDFSTIFQQAYAQAKRCDDLERFRKVMRNIVGTGDSNECCNQSFGLSAPCDYSDGKGGIDPNKLFACEYKRLEEAEKLARFRKVFQGILSDDKCKDECKTKGVSYYAPNDCPPGYAPVVLESASPSYYRYVKCD